MNNPEALNIIVIEDSEAHAKILNWAFNGMERQPRVTFYPSGESVLARLELIEESSKSFPDLIFLDLNLPQLTGKDILRKLKTNPKTREIPVIVLSSSNNEHDVRLTYALGANTYICKSDILGELRLSLQKLIDYWSDLAKLPNRKG